ncbi:MAG: ArgE/DapE family deacylase [Gemmatimonadaceae bacterium]|jgi:acetylornithine deacetylase|nr:ArgE/DapE family deacylase [Gemmatimonadaceae bacterium]
MSTPPLGDAVALTRLLVAIDSRNPSLVPGAPGEGAVAHALRDVLDAWGIPAVLHTVSDGRANVVARVGPRGVAPLVFNGHLDVVGIDGMTHAPFAPVERGGRLYGRGSCDMKSGVAAMCAAIARAQAAGTLTREVWLTAVVDEEWQSEGTARLLADWRAGVSAIPTPTTWPVAAIVTEPTSLAICPAHRGFEWIRIEVEGRAAHGSRYELGVDAIVHAGLLLAALDRLEHDVLPARTHPLLGRASVHASQIGGGTGLSTYPDRCTLWIERRTLPGETRDAVLREFQALVDGVVALRPEVRATVHHGGGQPPSDVAPDAPVVQWLTHALRGHGVATSIAGMTAWTDAALFNDAGIPAICFGPGDIALAHAAEEWVPVDEITQASAVLQRLLEHTLS